MSMFLTNSSPNLCIFTLCIMFRKNSLFLARLLRISTNSNKIVHLITFRLQLILPEILNFQKIYNPTLYNKKVRLELSMIQRNEQSLAEMSDTVQVKTSQEKLWFEMLSESRQWRRRGDARQQTVPNARSLDRKCVITNGPVTHRRYECRETLSSR